MNLKLFLSFFLLYAGLPTSILSQPEPATLVMEHINIIDGVNPEVQPDMSVFIENGLIKSIFPSDSRDLPKNIKRMDMKGKFLTAGLIDGHVHLTVKQNREETLKKLLYSGVTSVRDMGGDARIYRQLISRIDSGEIEGPSIFYSATFFGPQFFIDPRVKFAAQGFQPGEAPWMRAAKKESSVKELISDAKKWDVTGIKLYSSLTPEQISQITEEAHRQNLKVWSHATIFPSKPIDAVNGGVDVLSHALGILLASQENVPDEFNAALKNLIPRIDFRKVNPDDDIFTALLDSMKARKVIFEPTLSAWKTRPRVDSTKVTNRTMSNTAAQMDIQRIIELSNEITRKAYNRDIPIAAGTDQAFEIKFIHDEIIYLVEAGLSPHEAIKAATSTNATVLGISDTRGTVEEGKVADLIVLHKNPLDVIQNIRSVEMVIKSGLVVQGAE